MSTPTRQTPLAEYGFEAFEVGESRFYPIDDRYRNADHATGTAYTYGKRAGRKFKTHACVENGVHGYRIWRTA